ncbi:hypothetical protein VX159_06415 [Dechloromonas sp. ZY10]|uniref:hypothetical protein n=1 Tax=Dechloromonas aquae TaxID=2664436 RepID=UPI0035294FC0
MKIKKNGNHAATLAEPFTGFSRQILVSVVFHAHLPPAVPRGSGKRQFREGSIMLLLAATEYAHRQLTRPRPASVPQAVPIPAFPEYGTGAPSKRCQVDGLRFQLLNALRGLAGGEPMLVKLPPPTPAPTSSLRPREQAAQGPGEEPGLDILVVPGTHHPAIIGRLLIAAGCCAPCPNTHWVPNLAVFQLTELGYAYYLKFQDWWTHLPWPERLGIMLRE